MNNTQLQLVTYEQAVRLKELGFDWEVKQYYRDGIKDYTYPEFMGYSNEAINDFSAPTAALALKWMRDVKGIFGSIDFDNHKDIRKYYYFYQFEETETSDFYGHYEAAESALLDELLTLLENENK